MYNCLKTSFVNVKVRFSLNTKYVIHCSQLCHCIKTFLMHNRAHNKNKTPSCEMLYLFRVWNQIGGGTLVFF